MQKDRTSCLFHQREIQGTENPGGKWDSCHCLDFPILPFINDTEENVNGILDYCIDAKVYGVLCFSMGLTLREGNREYFYAQLREKFPGLEKKYQSIYGNRYEVISPKNTRLMELLRRRCQENELEYRVKELFAYMRKFPCEETAVQLELSDFLEGFL